MKNPIIDNRIVNDITFATRLKRFMSDVEANCAMGQEELDYIKNVADELLQYQIDTCPKDSSENIYHLNLKPILDSQKPKKK